MRQTVLWLTLLALVPSTAVAYGEGEIIPSDAHSHYYTILIHYQTYHRALIHLQTYVQLHLFFHKN